ncbi:MAG: MoaD/ThiS family protein [Halieaceae bacterium]|jgi:molybdopterin converting factor small subunit|nr:MoaD/ThiS family protein [Halieaceae bacterium]
MPLVKVSYMSSLRSALGGAESLEIEATTLRQLMSKLLAKYPRLQKHLDEGIALAVNGEIYRDNWDVEIREGTEVYLMPRIQGG